MGPRTWVRIPVPGPFAISNERALSDLIFEFPSMEPLVKDPKVSCELINELVGQYNIFFNQCT
jgi:hypothetical protein